FCPSPPSLSRPSSGQGPNGPHLKEDVGRAHAEQLGDGLAGHQEGSSLENATAAFCRKPSSRICHTAARFEHTALEPELGSLLKKRLPGPAPLIHRRFP